MKPLFKCELSYYPSSHLSQLYDGFEKLRKVGIVDLTYIKAKGDLKKPLLFVTVNDKFKVVYDTLDGLNWLASSLDENLNFYKNIDADYYFKRSFNQIVINNAPSNCQVYPLGFNYNFNEEGVYPRSFAESIKQTFKNVLSLYFKQNLFLSKDFEYFPIPLKENKILFLTKLWNPDDVSLPHLKEERSEINKSRIKYITTCKREFGVRFTGGLTNDAFTHKHASSLIMPNSLTQKSIFLQQIKQHTICIGTSGLHNSIGWKFGEYVAASRAIVSEPLMYNLPGNFDLNKNYLVFNNVDELVNKTNELFLNQERLLNMMNENYIYYNNFLRSDKLILNTLLRIYENENKFIV